MESNLKRSVRGRYDNYFVSKIQKVLLNTVSIASMLQGVNTINRVLEEE